MGPDCQSSISLTQLFSDINQTHFDGFLEVPTLAWNGRLRSTSGRFTPGKPPQIEVASYLVKAPDAEALCRDTLAHEMIHYWLWVMGLPYGHTDRFLNKLNEMGASRYNRNPYPLASRYIYRCQGCHKEFPVRKKLGRLACQDCCQRYGDGRFDGRFQLSLLPKGTRKGTASGSLGGI